MAFEKKTWTDRIAEYINRRLLTKEDGGTEIVTVAREEGTISQEGDAFSAANMNDLETRIDDEFNSLNLKLNQKGKRIAPLKASQTNMTVHDTVVFELPLLKIVFMSVTFSINSGGNIQLFIIEDKYRPVENSTLLISNSAIGATAYTDGKIAYDSDGHGLALGIGTYTMIGMYRYFV